VLVVGSTLFVAYVVANPTPTLIACALLAVAFPPFRFGQRDQVGRGGFRIDRYTTEPSSQNLSDTYDSP
jgi:hypothetical protein